MAQNCKNPKNTFAINFLYFLSVIVITVSSFENVTDNLAIRPPGAAANVKTNFWFGHQHRLRHGHGLELPRRYARETGSTSSNISWPVKRSADVEGDIILGKNI